MGRNIVRSFVGTVLICSLLTFSVSAWAGTSQIGGVGVQAATCNQIGSLYTIVMAGSLVGCWYTDTLEPKITPSGAYKERGTETFVGCLVENGNVLGCGTFHTEY